MVVAPWSIVHMHLQSLPEPRRDVVIANVGPGGVCLQQTNDINLYKTVAKSVSLKFSPDTYMFVIFTQTPAEKNDLNILA